MFEHRSEKLGGFVVLLCVLISLFTFIPTSPVEAALVDINTAGSEELQTLTGVGPVIAGRIIDYRNLNGLFQKLEDIKNVSGIGEATYLKIKDFITIGNLSNDPSAGSGGEDVGDSSGSGNATVYSQTSVTSGSKPTANPSISIGKDKIITAQSPVEFRIESNVKLSDRYNVLRWNFGDGTESGGEAVSHTYEFPGDYVVVLKAVLSNSEVLVRVNVKVVEPDISITLASSERIEIQNNSKYEINLYGRALSVGSGVFAFPRDTIVKAGARISFSRKITGLVPQGVSDTSLMIVGEGFNLITYNRKIESDRLAQISKLETQLNELKERMVQLRGEESSNEERVVKSETLDSSENRVSAPKVIKNPNLESSGFNLENTLILESLPEIEVEKRSGWFEAVKSFFLRRNAR
jgi:comEA protein